MFDYYKKRLMEWAGDYHAVSRIMEDVEAHIKQLGLDDYLELRAIALGQTRGDAG